MFEVVSPASDRTLLTLAELRDAVGATDASLDPSLRALGNYITATLVSAARLRTDGATPATFRLESVRDTFRSVMSVPIGRHRYVAHGEKTLYLSRKPIVAITSIIENDVALTSDDYVTNKSGAALTRLTSDIETCWPAGKIVVDYTAGYSMVPYDLKFAARRFVALIGQQADRDPLLRRKVIPGVSEKEWWVEPAREVGVPPEIMDLLERGGFVEELEI